MSLRKTEVGPDELELLRTLAEFAGLPENEFRPGPGVPQPGEDPRHVRILGTLRVVFSITCDGRDKFRHLSVSVCGGDDDLPHPEAVEAVARGLGFTGDMASCGGPGGWEMMARGRHVVVGQRLQMHEPGPDAKLRTGAPFERACECPGCCGCPALLEDVEKAFQCPNCMLILCPACAGPHRDAPRENGCLLAF